MIHLDGDDVVQHIEDDRDVISTGYVVGEDVADGEMIIGVRWDRYGDTRWYSADSVIGYWPHLLSRFS